MEAAALYVPDGDGYVGTILTQGGWAPDGANGGTVMALMGQCLDDVPTLVPMTVSRFTADLVRPVPLGRRLDVVPTILREGKKIQLVQLLLVDHQSEVELVRVTALRLRDADLTELPVPASTTAGRPTDRPADALVPPDQGVSLREVSPHNPGFLRAVDMRRAKTRDGSSTGCWLKLDVPVIAGRETTSTARLAAAIDFANLIGLDGPTGDLTMINPDVTAQVLRQPVGEWIAVTGDTRFQPDLGRGISTAVLSDERGVFATSSTSQLLQPR